MSFSAGSQLGPYEIRARIGSGGMGEVYRATDTRLRREVAVKVSAERFSDRFEREARAVASLNHPNICTLFDIGPNYLVMELVDGETIAERIKRGTFPVEEALTIARQIAAALDAAHQKGIVHRDLKPGNIMIKPDGTVKVLDFGLAKTPEQAAAPGSESQACPTVTLPAATQIGTIMGTAGYMAPEQARGSNVDKRADIFAFGVVLYEMLQGKPPFVGETVSDTLAAVLKDEPKLDQLPAKVRTLLQRCLEKDPKNRLRDIGDVWLLVDERAPAGIWRGRAWPAWVVTAIFCAALSALAFVHFGEKPPTPLRGSFQITLPDGLRDLEISPDGRYLAFVAGDAGQLQIWVRALDSVEATRVPGTEGGRFPFWSPNGENLGFFADGKLKKIALAGGPPQILCDAPTGRGGSWNRDGVIVFAPQVSGGLYRIAADGGAPTPLTQSGTYPQFIQGGKRFLFLSGPDAAGVYAGSLDGMAPVHILADASRALYVPPAGAGVPGYVLFRREDTLMALPFDPDKLSATGSAFPLAAHVMTGGHAGYGDFAASQNGVLAYGSESGHSGNTLAFFDRSGRRLDLKSGESAYTSLALSPDGSRAAVAIVTEGRGEDVWMLDLKSGVQTRFTFNRDRRSPVWCPDGTLIFSSTPKVVNIDFYRRPSNGVGAEQLLLNAGVNAWPADASTDGKWLVYSQTGSKTQDDIWLLPLASGSKPIPYLDSRFEERQPQFSPDSKWIAYTSDESGQEQVYVQSIPATGAKRQVSINGGGRARWRRDGKELFYVSADSKLMAVPAKVGAAECEFGSPRNSLRSLRP